MIKCRNPAHWELRSITPRGASEPGPHARPPRPLLLHPEVAKGLHAWNRKLVVDTLVWKDRRAGRQENATCLKHVNPDSAWNATTSKGRHTHAHTCLHTLTRTCTDMHTRAHAHTRVHTYMLAHACTDMHTHSCNARTRSHTHTLACTRSHAHSPCRNGCKHSQGQ